MSGEKPTTRGQRIIDALKEFADDLKSGRPIEEKYNVREVRFVTSPRPYTPDDVRSVRQLLDSSEENFARLFGVKPATIRSWENGTRKPSTLARRFLEEIRMAPDNFRGQVIEPSAKSRRSITLKKTQETPGSAV